MREVEGDEWLIIYSCSSSSESEVTKVCVYFEQKTLNKGQIRYTKYTQKV